MPFRESHVTIANINHKVLTLIFSVFHIAKNSRQKNFITPHQLSCTKGLLPPQYVGPAGRFRHRFHRLCTHAPVFNPELDPIPGLNPQAVAKGFGDGELSFTTNGNDRVHGTIIANPLRLNAQCRG
jgi:hypothetical protein